jgi:hypothetical protein
MPSTSRQRIADALLRTIGEEACEALAKQTLGSRADAHLSRTPLDLDPTGWRDVATLLEETLDRVLAIQDESSARLADDRKETIASKLAILHFESPTTPKAEPWAWFNA